MTEADIFRKAIALEDAGVRVDHEARRAIATKLIPQLHHLQPPHALAQQWLPLPLSEETQVLFVRVPSARRNNTVETSSYLEPLRLVHQI